MCPPEAPLTWTVIVLPLSVAKPIIQPALIEFVGGRVTVSVLGRGVVAGKCVAAVAFARRHKC